MESRAHLYRRGSHDREMVVAYRRTDKINNTKSNGSQIYHCQRKDLQILK